MLVEVVGGITEAVPASLKVVETPLHLDERDGEVEIDDAGRHAADVVKGHVACFHWRCVAAISIALSVGIDLCVEEFFLLHILPTQEGEANAEVDGGLRRIEETTEVTGEVTEEFDVHVHT